MTTCTLPDIFVCPQKNLISCSTIHLYLFISDLHANRSMIISHSSGSFFGQLLSESYRRLIDLVAVPELPTPIQATHGTSHYKNIFIPPIGCQRLISLDDRLIIIGPRSIRHSTAPEQFRKRSIRDEGSDDTNLSSVINSYETGHVIIEMPTELPYDQSEYTYQQSHNIGPYREKWEPAGLNLGYISEEAEASHVDTVLTTASAMTRDSTLAPSLRNSVVRSRSKRRSNNASADKNNNADREEPPKKRGVGSKLNLRTSRQVLPQSIGSYPAPSAAGAASGGTEGDVLSQILGITADVPVAARPSRGSSVVGLNQRPSTFGISGTVPGSKMNVNFGRQRGQSVMKVTSKKSVAMTQPKPGSILDISPRPEQGKLFGEYRKPATQEPPRRSISKPEKEDKLPEIQTLNEQKFIEKKIASDISDNDRRLRASFGQRAQPNNVLLPVQEVGSPDSRRPSGTPSVPKAVHSSVMSAASGSALSGSAFSVISSQASKNDSLESVDLRNFQAALKKDLHLQKPGQADREKAMIQPILEYRRRSVLEETPSMAEHDRTTRSSEDRIKSDRSDSVDARYPVKIGKSSKLSVSELRISHDTGNQQSSFTMSREAHQDKRDGRSHEAVNIVPTVGKSLKQGSHMSLMDITAKAHKPSMIRKFEVVPYERKMEVVPYEGKTRKSTAVEQAAPVRRSVMNLDSRAKDVHDSRLAYADKMDKRSQMHRFSVSVVPTDASNVNDLIMHAADATSGPFKKRSSNMESSLRNRMSMMDSKPFEALMRYGTHRPSMAKSTKSEDSLRSSSPRKVSYLSYKTRATQYDIKMISTNAAIQTTLSISSQAHKYPSIDLEQPSPMRTKRMSYDDRADRSPSQVGSYAHSFTGRQPQSQLELLAVKCQQSSSCDHPSQTKKKSLTSHHRPTIVEAPSESLKPLLAPISGTVLPTMNQITRARSCSKKQSSLAKSTSLCSIHAPDSDIDTLLYNNLSTYDGIRIEAGDYGKQKSKRLEVKSINTHTSECELFTWRWTTAKILKLTPVTHCFGIDESRCNSFLRFLSPQTIHSFICDSVLLPTSSQSLSLLSLQLLFLDLPHR